jgi:nitrate reductase delta subunit
MLIFKALSALLPYPTAAMREALPDIAEVVLGSSFITERERAGLLALIGELNHDDLLAVEERYVDLFDRGRALSLNLFEHLHGDSRDRGTAMIDLKQLYAKSGFELSSRELPDFLPVLLEYLSQQSIEEARELLADCSAILASICRSLIARQSRYASVLQALLVIAGEPPIDAAKIPPVRNLRENIDQEWAEQPAFANATLGAGGEVNQ